VLEDILMHLKNKIIIIWIAWLIINIIPFRFSLTVSGVTDSALIPLGLFLLVSSFFAQGIFIILFILDITAPILTTIFIIRKK
jgi:hypothetical protein